MYFSQSNGSGLTCYFPQAYITHWVGGNLLEDTSSGKWVRSSIIYSKTNSYFLFRNQTDGGESNPKMNISHISMGF